MLVSVLASGSEGNCTYVETEDLKCLIDIGTNTKYIVDRLSELDVNPKEINCIFMTHTHNDHTSAMSTFIKRFHPMVAVSDKMLDDLDILNGYDKILLLKDEMIFGSTMIKNFKTSHDTSDSRGYLIECADSSLVYMTDTGYLNQKYFEMLTNKNMYIIEANHDVEMLINGKYPKWLKTRILSDKGHLSNNAAGFYLAKLIGQNTKNVILAHLSHENNTPEEALKTVKKTLCEYDVTFDNIEIAKQKEKTEEIVL